VKITIKAVDVNGKTRRAVLTPSSGGYRITGGDMSRYQVKRAARGVIPAGTVITTEKKEKQQRVAN